MRVQVEVHSEALGEDSDAKESLIEHVHELVLPVKAKLTTSVTSKIKDGEETCGVLIGGCTTAGSDQGCCSLEVEGTAKEISTNAIASVGMCRFVCAPVLSARQPGMCCAGVTQRRATVCMLKRPCVSTHTCILQSCIENQPRHLGHMPCSGGCIGEGRQVLKRW